MEQNPEENCSLEILDQNTPQEIIDWTFLPPFFLKKIMWRGVGYFIDPSEWEKFRKIENPLAKIVMNACEF